MRLLNPQEPEQTTEAGATIPTDSTFEVHFIDVGQADAALVLCDGHAMLIDGGNSGDSSLIYSYLKNHGISYLDVVVATHGHEDHVGGLSGALNFASVGKAYCSVTSYDSDAFDDFVKYLGKHNTTITVPKPGDTFQLGSAAVQIVELMGMPLITTIARLCSVSYMGRHPSSLQEMLSVKLSRQF